MSATDNSPLYSNDNFEIPKDRIEMNAWNRHYYASNPLIANWIDTICMKVYGQFKINGAPEYKKAFFDKKGMFKFNTQMYHMVKELNVIGEAIPYLIVDEDEGTFDMILHNPDYIKVQNNNLQEGVVISLQPDVELKRLVVSDKDEDKRVVSQIDSEIISNIKEGKLITLFPNYVSHLALKNSPYDVRGTSIITRHLKTLLLEDQMRELIFRAGKTMEITILCMELRKEVESEAFGNKLHQQRNMLQEFIEKKILGPYGIIHDLPQGATIEFVSALDAKDFGTLFED